MEENNLLEKYSKCLNITQSKYFRIAILNYALNESLILYFEKYLQNLDKYVNMNYYDFYRLGKLPEVKKIVNQMKSLMTQYKNKRSD